MLPIGLHSDPSGRLSVDDFSDPYLELVHLLRQAAGLEHSLMAAYLYAAFSIKPRYASIRGDVTDGLFGLHRLDGGLDSDLTRRHSLLDVAVEEMQHLGSVNELLRDLGAAPVMTPHAFPMSADIYQFSIDLRPLTQPVAATYLWVEAESFKLIGHGPGSEPPAFQQLVLEALSRLPDPIDDQSVSHLGSLYNAIVRLVERVAADPPPFTDPLVDWPAWLSRMDWILGQGEIAHYQFFRDVFSGSAFLPDSDHPGIVWADPGDEIFPSHDLARGSAWKHSPSVFPDDDARQLAWLGDLHYWLILGLLDHAYRGRDRAGRYQAVGQMTRALWSIGVELADRYRVGFPFDPLAPSYQMGSDGRLAVDGLLRLAREAVMVEQRIAGLLPNGYDVDALDSLIAQLEGDLG